MYTGLELGKKRCQYGNNNHSGPSQEIIKIPVPASGSPGMAYCPTSSPRPNQARACMYITSSSSTCIYLLMLHRFGFLHKIYLHCNVIDRNLLEIQWAIMGQVGWPTKLGLCRSSAT